MITRRGLFKGIVGGLAVLFMPKRTKTEVETSTIPNGSSSTSSSGWGNVHNCVNYYIRGGPCFSPFCSSCSSVVADSSKGKLLRCYGERRDDTDEYPFICQDDGTMVANLEGYAIIPIEKWKKLTGEQIND